ncbi:putative ribonuclease H-like domain-containing protein [Tanacetum coccineum]
MLASSHYRNVSKQTTRNAGLDARDGYGCLLMSQYIGFVDISEQRGIKPEFVNLLLPMTISSSSATLWSGGGILYSNANTDHATLEATHADFFGDEAEVDMSNITTTYLVPSTPNTRIHKDHSLDHVIGDMQSGEKPKRIAKSLSDSAWVETMQKEFLQFILHKVWELVDLPKSKRAIGTKWVFRDKKDERGIVIQNKARMVTQGHTQEEGIDYDEIFAPVARIRQ